MSKNNFVVSEPKSTKFFASNVKLRVVENTIYHLSISFFILEIFAVKVQSCQKMRALSTLGGSE